MPALGRVCLVMQLLKLGHLTNLFMTVICS